MHKKRNIYMLVFLIYIIITGIANWSLLLGDNMMKWDMMAGNFPLSAFIADSLKNGIFPLWIPQMRYGFPLYITVGDPLYYPPIILLAFLGYPVVSAALMHTMHVVLACFGMFLLTVHQKKDKEQDTWQNYVIPFVIGLLYGYSTVFLSNASHIMIVVSAAWIPYVLLFAQRYMEEQKIKYIMLTGFCLGFSMIGGYPELWVATFLILIPWVLFWNYRRRVLTGIKLVIDSGIKYVILCISACCASAATLIPFLLSLSKVPRMASELGMAPEPYPPALIASMFLPKFDQYFRISGVTPDVTMINAYMGLICFLALPMILSSKIRNKLFYMCMSAWAVVMILGSGSFVHSLFYKFFPMFSTLRFPNTWRCILAVFLLLMLSDILEQLFDSEKIQTQFIKNTKLLGVVCLTAGIVIYMATVLWDMKKGTGISESFMVVGFLCLLYLALLFALKEHRITEVTGRLLLSAVVIVEVLTYQYMEAPVTITEYKATETLYSTAAREELDIFIERWDNREHKVDMADSSRSRSGINSLHIIGNNLLDEKGYLSILLDHVERYSDSMNNIINQSNPEAYFTNNYADSDITLEDWLHDITVPAEQIYVLDAGAEVKEAVSASVEGSTVSETEIPLMKTGTIYNLSGDFAMPDNTTLIRKLKLFWEDADSDSKVNITFIKEDGTKEEYSAQTYTVINSNGQYYSDIYFPSYDKYTDVIIEAASANIQKADYIVAERQKQDKFVTIESLVPNYMKMSVSAPAEGHVVVLQSDFPGWHAYVDGKETQIETINGAFMGVSVTEGQHEIEWKFRPVDFYVGAVISTVHFACLVAVVLYDVKKKGRKQVESESTDVRVS